MAILIPVGRSWSAKVLPRSSFLLTRLLSTRSSGRVPESQRARTVSARPQCSSTTSSALFLQVRTFADAAPAGRPKAHTGRSAAKRSATDKTAVKSKAKPKKKAKSKAKSKSTVKAKSKAEPKSTAKAKKELSEAGQKRKEASKRSELKKQALLRSAPKGLPSTAWTVFFVENGPKKGEALDKSGNRVKATAQEYRNISAEERERLNRIAGENKAQNEAAYKEWVQSHTPLQIKQANHARDLLRQEARKLNKKTSFPRIKDERLPKLPQNQFSLFLQERFQSGDLKGQSIAEAGKRVAQEWKDLSPTEKKAYDERFAADRIRYQDEYKRVYGIDPPSVKASSESPSP